MPNIITCIFERIQKDYLVPINNKMFLIIKDSYSKKWPEVFDVANADIFNTLKKLVRDSDFPNCI